MVDIRSGTPELPLSPKPEPGRSSVITTRSDLLQALCDAAQLEHGLCCAYLFAAFSIKRRPEEGVPLERLADLRKWESVLLLIARQEMEHLGIVCNLLTAIGGMPYLQNPTFPIVADRYGDLPRLPLQRFSGETIRRFLAFETPELTHLRQVILSRIAGKGHPTALSIACKQICAEMEWAEADVWELKGGTFVPILRLTGGVYVAYGPEVGQEMWSRWQTPHPPKGEDLRVEQTPSSSTVNTYVEVPSYQDGELKAVWRFFYETFRTVDEDDALAEAVELLLSELDLYSFRDRLDDVANPQPNVANALQEFEPRYATIGGFYRQIRKGFLRICFRNHQPIGKGLFTGFQTGNPDIGILDRYVHDMDMPTVSDLDSALAAIEEIIENGEAAFDKRVASHYVRLKELMKEFESVMAQGGTFEPARATVDNPVTARPTATSTKLGCTLLEHPDAVAVAEIFDATYEITLQMVARFFACPDDTVLEGMAFAPLMTMAIRPLAEILGELNASEHSDQKAGPPFQSSARDILHPHRLAAWTVFGERLQQIALACAEAQHNLRPEHQQAGERLTFIGKNIKFIASRLQTAVAQAKAGTLASGAGN
jgi:hypothetical protein